MADLPGLRRRFLRRFFHLLYNQLAWTYDLVAWLVSFGQWRAWARATLPHLHADRILELGHGPGHLLLSLERAGFAPVGVDLSRAMGTQARARLRRADSSVSLVRAEAQRLPFPGDAFDSIVATFPSEFITDVRTLRQIGRVLAPSGRLVVAASLRFEGNALTSRFLRWLYEATGQTEPSPERFLPLLERAALSPRIAWEKVGNASIMLVIAETA